MTSPCFAAARCRAHGRAQRVDEPLCGACLDGAERDIRALVWDYVDLEQHLVKARVVTEPISGTRDPGVVLMLDVEALQRAIWLATTTWEEVLRDLARLAPVDPRVRDGFAVARAVRVIAPRVAILARLPEVAVMMQYRPDDELTVTQMTGAQAVLDLCRLHATARAFLGLTRLVHELPGECPDCGLASLRRDDGRETVYCAHCPHICTWDEYRQYVILTLAELR